MGAILDTPTTTIDEVFIKNRLEQMETHDSEGDKYPLEQTDTVGSVISRHDQYHGIGRVATKDQRQGW